MKKKIAFALLMGIITTGIITFSVSAVKLGFSGHFFQAWCSSWGIAYAVVIPSILFIGPRVERLVQKLF